jgi:hypothetical protein
MMPLTTTEVLQRAYLLLCADDSFRSATLAGTYTEVDGQYVFRAQQTSCCPLHATVCCRDPTAPKGGYSGVVTQYHASGDEWTILLNAGESFGGEVHATGGEFQVELHEGAEFVYLKEEEH